MPTLGLLAPHDRTTGYGSGDINCDDNSKTDREDKIASSDANPDQCQTKSTD